MLGADGSNGDGQRDHGRGEKRKGGKREGRVGRPIISLFFKLGTTVAATGLEMRMWSEAVKACCLYSHLFLPSPTLQHSKLPPLLFLLDGVIRPGPLDYSARKHKRCPKSGPRPRLTGLQAPAQPFSLCLFAYFTRRPFGLSGLGLL